MSLTELAGVADLVAALGVMLSVAVLAYEMHRNRKQAELANWRELLQTLIDYKGLTNDLVFADLVERGHADYDALTPSEQRAFGLYLEQGIHIFGNFLKHNDSLPRKLTGLDQAIANMYIDMLATPGGAAWWSGTRDRGHFMPATYRQIDGILAGGRKPTAPPIPTG